MFMVQESVFTNIPYVHKLTFRQLATHRFWLTIDAHNAEHNLYNHLVRRKLTLHLHFYFEQTKKSVLREYM